MATSPLCSNVKSTTRLWQRPDLTSHFAPGSVACWAGRLKCMALCAVCSRMHLHGHPHLCTQHYNSDQTWTFWTCSRAHLLCPPGKDTDYMWPNLRTGGISRISWIFILKRLYLWNHTSYELQTWHEYCSIILLHLLQIAGPTHGRASTRVNLAQKTSFYASL